MVAVALKAVADDFYPRPPRGGRRGFLQLPSSIDVFLSTPSARRATSATAALYW